jgi:hypothetical protein
MRRAAPLALTLLAACGSPDRAPQAPPNEAAQSTPAPAALPAAAPTAPGPGEAPKPALASEPSPIDSRDCRTVAQAYFDALARTDYATAARMWDDPAVGEARLKAVFAGYKKPTITVTDLQQEGAAGSSYCTVSGTLSDGAQANEAPKKGDIVLKRVNDVPGATPQQLRWTIRSSRFVEKLGQAG